MIFFKSRDKNELEHDGVVDRDPKHNSSLTDVALLESVMYEKGEKEIRQKRDDTNAEGCFFAPAPQQWVSG